MEQTGTWGDGVSVVKATGHWACKVQVQVAGI